MSSLRSNAVFCLILLTTVLSNPGCQRHSAPPKGYQKGLHLPTPQKHLGPEDIYISGVMLSLPKGLFATFDPDFRAKLDSGHSVDQAIVAKFLTDSRIRLIQRPCLIAHNEENSSYILEGDGVPLIGFYFVPLLQPDGSVRLISSTVLNPAGRKSRLDVRFDQRVIHSAVGSYEVIKGMKWKDDDLFFFIQVFTADTVNSPDAGGSNLKPSR